MSDTDERFTVKTSPERPEYLAPKLQSLSAMDKKIPILLAAAQRAARVAGPHVVGFGFNPPTLRFKRLWKARNRRTRVLMERAQREMYAPEVSWP